MAIQAQLYWENIGFPLCGSQDWMDNGCGSNEFCFNLQQKQQPQQQYMQQQLQNQQQRNQNPSFDNSLVFSNNNNNHLSMAYSQSIAAQIEKQRQEIDQFISLQNERLRLALQEQSRQQVAALLKKFEPKTLLLLRQKDEEIAKAAQRTMELEEFMRRMEVENQAWQRVAKENEAAVVSLNNTLEQLREKACCWSTDGAEDAESCCDFNGGDRVDETEENRGRVNEEVEEQRRRKMVCKSCNSRSSCVIFLPCRHLCSCKACEAFLDSCPVCRTVKKASIEALIF